MQERLADEKLRVDRHERAVRRDALVGEDTGVLLRASKEVPTGSAPENVWAETGAVEMILGISKNLPELRGHIMIMRRLLLATPLLAAAMVAVIHPWSSVQARPSFLLTPNSSPWPPVDPEDIVNVLFDQDLTGGQSVAVFSVPAKRHLVVTQVGLVNGSGGFDAHLVEHTRDGSTVKLSSLFTVESRLGIGLVFAPGSSIDVVNTLSKTDHVTLTLFGYLAPSRDWPPVKPADVFDTTGEAIIPFGDSHKIYDVPQDRWLVITSQSIRGTGNFALLEVLDGVPIKKPQLLQDSQLVGVAFHPGSSIVLRNDEPFSGGDFHWLLTGYLVR